MTQRSRKVIIILLAILAIAFALSLFLRTHFVRSESNGTLFWNTEDAYIFIGLADYGYRPSYLGFVGDVITEIFPFGAPSPDEKHYSLLVLHVTPNSVQHYTVDNFWLGSGPDLFHGELYLRNLLTEKSMKWSDDRLESSGDLPTKFDSYWKSTAGPSYDNIEGWSKRPVAGDVIRESPTDYVEKDSVVTIKVAGRNLTFIMNSGFISHHAYVDLIRPSQPPKRIWYLDGAPHRISGSEYNRIFAYQLVRKALSH